MGIQFNNDKGEIMEYKNPISTSETQDLGSAIQGLIETNIANINTAFLAKVTQIQGNKVNIIPLLKDNATEPDTILNNILIAQPQSGEWSLNFKVSVGDIGLAIVSKQDISTYKSQGSGGVVNTKRTFDIIDSVFLPLSLYMQKDNESLGLSIQNKAGDSKIEFDTEGKLSIEANEISIKAKNPLEIGVNDTLKACFDVILDNLQTGIVGGVTSGSPASQTITSLPNLAPQIQIMKQKISEVLK